MLSRGDGRHLEIIVRFTRCKPITDKDLCMIHKKSDFPLLSGALFVGLLAIAVGCLVQALIPLTGMPMAVLVGAVFSSVAAFAALGRMRRWVIRLERIVDGAQGVLSRVSGPGGDHVLRIGHDGKVVSDIGATFGNALEFGRPLTGQILADLCDDDGYLVVPPTVTCAERTFVVRRFAHPDGAIACLREVADPRVQSSPVGYERGFDGLTNLPNRQAFIQALEQSCLDGKTGFVVLLEIDNLRSLNERHGESVGDGILRAFAAEAGGLVRNGDSLARISGGTFAMILAHADSVQVEKVASRLIGQFGSITRPMGDAIIRASASAGIAPCGQTAAETLCDAEAALKIAKSRDFDRFEMARVLLRRA